MANKILFFMVLLITAVFLVNIPGACFAQPADSRPLLVMDVFEHAFMLDYGLKRADYIEAFFNNIDWNVVESRLK